MVWKNKIRWLVLTAFFVACTDASLDPFSGSGGGGGGGGTGVSYKCSLSGPLVLGQGNFTTNGFGTSSTALSFPSRLDCWGTKLAVAEQGNHRVMLWSNPTSNGQAADVVLGHVSFAANASNDGGGTSNYALNIPKGVAIGGGKLFISDENNQRVLVWNSWHTSNGQAADLVLGQPNFAGNTAWGGTSADYTNFWSPGGLAATDTKLLVTVRSGNRVMIWSNLPTSNNQASDIIIGQPDGTTTSSGTTSSKFNQPEGVCTDGTRVAVADTNNNRVMIWNSFPTTTGQAADIVLGQPDFTSLVANNGGLSAGMSSPTACAIFNGQLAVADTNNSRILIWSTFPTATYAAPDKVFGQPNLTSSGSNNPSLSAPGLSSPGGILWISNYLYVGDRNNHRVMIYSAP